MHISETLRDSAQSLIRHRIECAAHRFLAYAVCASFSIPGGPNDLRLVNNTTALPNTLVGIIYVACRPETGLEPQESSRGNISSEDLDRRFYQTNQCEVDFSS